MAPDVKRKNFYSDINLAFIDLILKIDKKNQGHPTQVFFFRPEGKLF